MSVCIHSCVVVCGEVLSTEGLRAVFKHVLPCCKNEFSSSGKANEKYLFLPNPRSSHPLTSASRRPVISVLGASGLVLRTDYSCHTLCYFCLFFLYPAVTFTGMKACE